MNPHSPLPRDQSRRIDNHAAQRIIDAQNSHFEAVDAQAHLAWSRLNPDAEFDSVEQYFAVRERAQERQRALGYDFHCFSSRTSEEEQADAIIKALRKKDEVEVYDAAPPRIGHGGQRHPRFPGDHFLSNEPLINQTALFNVAAHMPKGAHLHIHFNACLEPHVLLNIAKGMDRMFITSDLPLVEDSDYVHYDRCEVQFSLMSPEKECPGDLFSRDYEARQTMKFSEFLDKFSAHYPKRSVEEWLLNKLVFNEREAHDLLQTASGAWEKFNGRTRMMKGLFNYETAYRKYTRLCLEDFVRDNILYAEIRPNFMMSNQLYHDDGTGPIDNWGIMEIIITEVEAFKRDMDREKKTFGGLKVIYCTPRSFKPDMVKMALDECIEFKKKWPQWIAGFDLVGEESKGRPLKDFVPIFLEFQKKCKAQNLEIPFLFHCGETLDIGTDTDGNLWDALLLNSKRIGHGFALPNNPAIMASMKKNNVCVELCPISNEILGLTPRMGGHTMYQLLANNVHCTVSSDNGTLFQSSLSHDFYQAMIGNTNMGLYGWKQLILWSLEHACLDEQEYRQTLAQWEQQWEAFIHWIIAEYGDEVEAKMHHQRGKI
ncbi:adenosine deaminase [Mariannaea sp. PMI_226]|nr:adenosine deaminase [Mariannaea sp. PMI_226]